MSANVNGIFEKVLYMSYSRLFTIKLVAKYILIVSIMFENIMSIIANNSKEKMDE